MQSGRVGISVPILVASCVCMAACDAPEPQSDSSPRRFAGSLTWPGGSWELEIQLPENASDSLQVYVPSLWRPPTPPGDSRVTGDSLWFDLPWDYGTAAARWTNEGVTGVATLNDSIEATLSLTPARWPEIARSDAVVDSDGTPIALSLARPAGEGPFPVVIVIHGGGDSGRDQPPVRFWSEWLPRRGIACITYDKRGYGQSGGDWREVGLDQRAHDVSELISWARQQERIDESQVGLLAVSQGTLLASMLAASDPALGFLIQVSAPVSTLEEADTWAQRSAALAADLAPREVEELLDLWRLEVEAIRGGAAAPEWNELDRAIERARRASWFSRQGFRASDPEGWFAQWYRRVIDYDPAADLRRSSMPMIWFYGDTDTQLDAGRSVERLERIRSELDKPWEIVVLERSGHGLLTPVDSLGRETGPLTIAPAFFPALEAWLGRLLARD